MLKDEARICDVCGDDIPKGEKYRVAVVPQRTADIFRAMTAEQDPDLIPTSTVDPRGNIRLDMCLACHLSMAPKISTHATEYVN